MSLVVSGGRTARVRSSMEVSLREAITDVSRQVEDLTWTSLSMDTRGLALDDMYEDRRRMIQKIRTYRRRNPLAKRTILLLQHYVLGQGISLKANNRAVVQKIVDEFWDDPVNQRVLTGYQGMQEALDTIATDGNLFLTLFPDAELGRLQLSMIDLLYVDDIIVDPENAKVPLWYKVRKFRQDFDFTQGTYVPHTGTDFVYYRDWKNGDDESSQPAKPKTDFDDGLGGPGIGDAGPLIGQKGNPDGTPVAFKPPKDKIADGLVYHVAINRRGKFGESEFAASVDWLKVHKEFMEDRASISKAAALYSWKKKRKGPASDIAAATQALASSMTQNINKWEYNPPAAAGSTVVENEGSTLDWIKTDTGAGDALNDERIMRMMVGAGVGVMNHYFGDEANANLATATAMELPMLKMYEAWQTLLTHVIKDVLDFLLQTAQAADVLPARDDQSKYAPAQQAAQGAISMAEAPFGATPPGEDALGPAGGAPGGDAGGGAAAPPTTIDAIVALWAQKAPSKNPVAGPEWQTKGPLDWYVDVDFPPIIQKDIVALVTAIKGLDEMMPDNLPAQQLVVRMLLTALGQTDLDEVMDAIFAQGAIPKLTLDANGMPVGVHPGIAALAGLLGPGEQKQLGPGTGTPPLPQEQQQQDAAPPDLSAREAGAEPLNVASLRVRRLLRSARAASDALARVGA